MPWLEYEDQRTIRGSWFFPLIMWIWRLTSSYCAWQQSPLATEPSHQLNSWVLNLQRIEELLKGNSAFLCRDRVTNWPDFCQLNCHITPRYLGLGTRRPQEEAHSTADAQLSPELFLALILGALGSQAVEPSVDRRKGKLRKPSEHATE